MTPVILSSGDPRLDRRLQIAEALLAEGDPAAAADLMAETVPLAPLWTAGWFRLGEIALDAGRAEAAAEAFARALALDPADRLGAGLRLDLLRGTPVAERMPSAFIETLYDGYAATFEASLVGKLGYRGPEVIAGLLQASEPRRFASALDLGCGTGLMGAALRPSCDRLEGWDISAAMLRQAGLKGCYDSLERRDLTTVGLPPAPLHDLITAADVFIYVGALERILGFVTAALLPHGLFAFSVEESPSAPLTLQPSRRFAHSEAYLRNVLAQAGFTDIALVRTSLRQDRGAEVPGLVIRAGGLVARPRPTGAALEAAD